MNKEVIFVLLDNFADWEGAFIAPVLNCGVEPGKAKYVAKTLSVTKKPVVSLGGFRVLPDYGINDFPEEYAGLVLVGGMNWFTDEALHIVPLVKKAIECNKLVAGICNATVFLGMHGFLNSVNHTSNALEYLKSYAGKNYTGDARYIDDLAVRDEKIVTANGLGALEFCREILYALEADTPEKIEENYRMYKTGIYSGPEK